MKPEIWISIYAAIVGTGALLLNFKNWLDSGAHLIVSIVPDGIVFGGDPKHDEKDLVIVNVINRGQASTMITNLTIHKIPSWYRLWRFRPVKSYLIPNPQLLGYPPNIPFDLEPNKRWTGVIRS